MIRYETDLPRGSIYRAAANPVAIDRLDFNREQIMNKILVWDIPARLIHWAFAAALTVAAVIGFLVDKEQPLFQLLMLFGIIAVLMLIVRMLMGLAGAR
jgi:Ni,Fe-hydrogenase I cytochrome b subunit